MSRTSRVSVQLALVACLLLACDAIQSVRADNSQDMNTAGYPTIAFFTSIVFLGYTLFYSAQKVGYGGFMNDLTWFCLNLFLAFAGLNLIFGPDEGYANGTSRAAIIGLQLVVQASMGIFAIYTNSSYAAYAYAIFGAFNALCLMGSNLLFNYNEPIWTLKTGECNAYFTAGNQFPYGPTGPQYGNFDRCSDSGFLEWLRVVGTVALSFELVVIVLSIMNYVNSLPVVVGANRLDGAAHTGVGGGYNSGVGGGYNAGPVVADTTH